MNLNGKEYVWEKNGKYFYSTSPYGLHGKELNYSDFCFKKLQGADTVTDENYRWVTSVITGLSVSNGYENVSKRRA